MHDPDPDDLDRLFARVAAPSPPPEIGARARVRLRAVRGAWRLTAIALADVAALAALAAFAFLLGAAFASSELPVLVRLAIEDRALALETRGELARAVVVAVPWPYVLAAALDVLLLCGLTTALLRATDTVRDPVGAGR